MIRHNITIRTVTEKCIGGFVKEDQKSIDHDSNNWPRYKCLYNFTLQQIWQTKITFYKAITQIVKNLAGFQLLG